MNWLEQPQRGLDKSSRGDIELNIDELVIRGVAPRDRHRIVQEIEEELTRLLKEGGVPPAFGPPSGMRRPEVSSKSQKAEGDFIARQVARDIYQGLRANR